MLIIVNSIGALIIGICFLIMYRNDYTKMRMDEAIQLIHVYCTDSIKNGTYDTDKDYFGDMMFSDDKYMYSWRLWGKNSAIKPEYKYIIK